MRKIDVKKLFLRLAATEYSVMKYLKRTYGVTPFEMSYTELSSALNTDKKEVCRACRRLVQTGAIIGGDGKFSIDTELIKEQ